MSYLPSIPAKSVYTTNDEEAIGVAMILASGVASFSAGQTVTQNLAYFIPIQIPNSFTVARFLWRNGATAAGNVTAALFNSAGTLQGTRTASTAQSGASGIQSAAPSGGNFTVGAGLYFMVIVSDSATATFAMCDWTVGYARMLGVQEQAANFALATPATLAAHSTDAKVPWIGISQLTTN